MRTQTISCGCSEMALTELYYNKDSSSNVRLVVLKGMRNTETFKVITLYL